jgi:hypothetical protein
VHDSRVLHVTLFGTLRKNLSALDFSLLLPDVMTIADEVDWQLTQATNSYMGVVGTAQRRSRICRLRSDYVSLYDARSMNGPTQSGGHWNAAFGLLAGTSDDVGSP